MPAAPDPESLPTWQRAHRAEVLDAGARRDAHWLERDRPIDLRYDGEIAIWEAEPRPPHQQVWMRADGQPAGRPRAAPVRRRLRVRHDAGRHRAAAARRRAGPTMRYMVASLDHAMWFHRPFRADEWLLYDLREPERRSERAASRSAASSRATAQLAVSVAQEGLIREAPSAAEGRSMADGCGGATASSTRSTRAPSRTRTATASATSRASASASTTSPGSASTRSGSRPASRRRWPTSATTSPTTATSTRSSARSRTSTGCSPTRTRAASASCSTGCPNHTSDRHPWFVESRASREQPEARLVRLARRAARRRAAEQLGRRSSAAPPGSSTRPPASTTCTRS